ncbi:MAG: glutamate-1-semialdehyde 2,1-aminomutase [Gammaproteobacteria bacterium]|jgi:glutamate-1-semialdehyde 2,1-aminomutase|nr:glutamate-1-semialdehyde 2,1-aminomutase [Gammaproteobacteria bacterium]HJO12562.1 glutamate-1-semialdehyde 2,1-aminomutase [Gammaproteobacteria bacterium]|tara:strand:+ start:221 stop:1513 length:1293 start_codon:yes stop_codon:yes gene_type:complete
MSKEKSRNLYDLALQYIPGGVNSPVRAFKGVGGNPLFFKASDGAWLIDVDNNRYIDYVGAWGPLILGHRHEKVIAALQEQLEYGIGYGASTEAEVDIAKKITGLVPSLEKVRLVTSGTEATMSAIRLARGFTGRDKVVKFEGCYHGHVDGLLVKAGSGALTLGEPDSLGVPKAYTDLTYVLPYNDCAAAEQLFAEHGSEIACVIVEPVAGNMNCVPPVPGFLQTLREQCSHFESVLIFDEVMTGFRTALGGAQSVYGVTPDLTTLGKVIGGGLPVGAFGGCAEIMDMIAPIGAVYQAGTLAGSPLAVAAGLAMLDEIAKPDFYTTLETRASQLLEGLRQRAGAANIPFTTNQVGAMFGCFFSAEEQVSHFSQVMNCNNAHFQTYFHTMLSNGVYLAPSSYEAGFISAAHSEEEIAITLDAAELAFAAINK